MKNIKYLFCIVLLTASCCIYFIFLKQNKNNIQFTAINDYKQFSNLHFFETSYYIDREIIDGPEKFILYRVFKKIGSDQLRLIEEFKTCGNFFYQKIKLNFT